MRQRAMTEATRPKVRSGRVKTRALRVGAWSGAGALAVSVAVASGGAAASSGTPHVMIVMMENEGASNVVGNAALPYVTSLAHDYGYATKSYAFGHPSLPNYLDIVSGSNQGVTDDNPPSSHSFPSVPTLADQLSSAGISERAYAESLPGDPTNNSGLYAVRHNPWEYFPHAHISVVGSSGLTSDLNAASPPDFVWYTPNLTDDGHTGVPSNTQANQLAQSEAFLSRFIPSVQTTGWYRNGGQIIIEWDEALDSSGLNGSSGGHVATIVVSSALKATPLQEATPVNTAGILRSVEDRFGLAHLANASNAANGTIDSLLNGAGPARSITNASHASATVGHAFQMTITTSGTPTPHLKKRGRLPKGLHFHNNHNGTATISGTPTAHNTPGAHALTVIATYGKGKAKQTVTQVLSLTIAG